MQTITVHHNEGGLQGSTAYEWKGNSKTTIHGKVLTLFQTKLCLEEVQVCPPIRRGVHQSH
jgi:hypothetical protein